MLARPLLYLTYFLLFLLYTPLGAEGGGATRWIAMSGISFQPSEILKIATIVFTAKIISDYQKDLRNPRAYGEPFFAIFPAIVMLIAQPDYGTMCLIFFLLGSILYLGGIPLDKLFKFGLILTPLLLLGAIAAPYRRKRLLAVMNPEGDALNSGWQTLQSLTGISNGGLLGVGPGSSKSKWWTPETHTDFIFTVIAEEMGLFGSLVVLGLFTGLVILGVQIAKQSNDKFGYLIAMGITSWFAVQAIVNIGVTIGQMPNTGLPLPFISYGGSSLLVGMAAIGIMLNIAQPRKR
jgi:cell division protein FtsW